MSKKEILDICFRSFIVIVSNILLSIATVWFLEPAKLYAGGATGLAQLFQRLIIKFGGNINLGLLIFIVNVPIIVIGFKFVSKKFAIYSILAIVVQSLFTGLIKTTPFQSLAEDIVSFTKAGVLVSTMNYGGILTLAIFGGLLAGFASGLALRFGTSTGGIDVVAQALALHKNFSMGSITMVLNILIAIIGGGVLQGSWIVVLFTIVRMILNSLVMDKIHTGYTYTGIHIFSKFSQEIGHDIMINLKRGCTFLQVQGAYTHENRIEIYCVVSTYEVDRVMHIVDKYDKKAFITMSPVKKIRGNFVKKSII